MATTGRERLIEGVASEAGRLGVGLAGVSGSVDVVSAAVAEQAGLCRTLEVSAEEVSANNHQVKSASQQTRAVAADAREKVGAGRDVFQAAKSDIGQLLEHVTGISDRLEGLNSALINVGKVAEKIDAIAKQTNLLALNATIEAARAGDAGRGFAVVAGEVKALANQTSIATADIQSTLSELNTLGRSAIDDMEQACKRAEHVATSSNQLSSTLGEIETAIVSIDERAAEIALATEQIGDRAHDVAVAISKMSEQAGQSNVALSESRDELHDLVRCGERLIGLSADAGVDTVDTPFIRKVREAAAAIGAAFDAEIKAGRATLADFFDESYRPIPDTNPEQKITRFVEITDRLLPAIQEPILAFDPRVVFCAAVDRNGFLPTHNNKFSQPQGKDPVWNATNARNRRMFNDRVGLAAGRNAEPFLLQTYRRDMGGGVFTLMKDLSAPIMIDGRHWGGLRLAYKI